MGFSCCNLFEFVMLPTDTPLERTRKKILLCLSIGGLCVMLVVVRKMTKPLPTAACYCIAFALVGALISLLVKKKAYETVLSITLMCSTICVLILDTNSAASNAVRTAPNVILFVDIALTCRLSKNLTIGIIIATTVQQFIAAGEGAFRFGLYDMSGFPSYDRRPRDCNCEEPPCPDVGRSLSMFFMVLSVFYLDYYFTRSFADSVTAENAKMESSIRTTQTIATCIAAFEIDKATLVLNNAEGLPSELEETLRRILRNLSQYKPYLPRSCFENDGSSEEIAASQAASQSMKSGTQETKSIEISERFQADLSWCRATLLVMNIKNSLSVLDQSVSEYKLMHATMTETALCVMGTYKGVVELFVGDRFHISFNAIKVACSHAASALKAAAKFRACLKVTPYAQLTTNSAIATGRVVKGDLGSIIMRRFTEIGKPTIAIHLIERYARKHNYSVLCNGKTAEECTDLPLQLLNVTLSCCGDDCFLFALSESNQELLIKSDGEVIDGEWMYHIKENPYSECNDATLLYLRQSRIPLSQRDKVSIASMVVNLREGKTEDELKMLLSSLVEDGSPQRSSLTLDFTDIQLDLS